MIGSNRKVHLRQGHLDAVCAGCAAALCRCRAGDKGERLIPVCKRCEDRGAAATATGDAKGAPVWRKLTAAEGADLDGVGDQMEERITARLDACDRSERKLRVRRRVVGCLKAEVARGDVQHAVAEAVRKVERAAKRAEKRLVHANLPFPTSIYLPLHQRRRVRSTLDDTSDGGATDRWHPHTLAICDAVHVAQPLSRPLPEQRAHVLSIFLLIVLS